MFKKFSPKEDVSSSTSLKSSVQRGIRNSILAQIPYLSSPAYRPTTESSTATTTSSSSKSHQAPPESTDPSDAPQPGEGDDEELEVEVEEVKEKKKGKGGKKDKEGKGKGKGKKDKHDKDKEEEEGKEEVDEAGSVLDDIWPKKEALGLTKCHDRISIYTVQSIPLFFQHFDGPYIPTLKILHQYPDMLPHVGIDRGAIKFLLAGANMMAPGLLSPGGSLPPNLPAESIVAIHAEGKEHACGIGKLVSSSEDIRAAGKGVAVEVICWIGDDLWKVDTIGL